MGIAGLHYRRPGAVCCRFLFKLGKIVGVSRYHGNFLPTSLPSGTNCPLSRVKWPCRHCGMINRAVNMSAMRLRRRAWRPGHSVQ